MSWEDMMRRILPPTGGFAPHVTSRYGERFNRPEGSSNPHGGVDFNYNVGPNGQRGINLQNPALRSPVDGVVENAGGGTVAKIAIRDKHGFLHEILHTQAQYVRVGEPVAAGQLIGAMGNTGVKTIDGKPGAHHVHYQLKDQAGRIMDPTAFADAQGPFDPNPAPPALHSRIYAILARCSRGACNISRRRKGSDENAGRKIEPVGVRFKASTGPRHRSRFYASTCRTGAFPRTLRNLAAILWKRDFS